MALSRASLAPLPKLALGAAAALAAINLSPGSAQAYVVTVNSVQYDVTTFVGSYSNNSTILTSQPWFGNQNLAKTFAGAVATSLGTPNTGIYGTPSSEGPYFAYTTSPDFAFFKGSGVLTNDIPANEPQHTWAKATLYTAPAPGPLPLLGAGAAFGFSRKLRKRIKLAPVALGSSLPRA